MIEKNKPKVLSCFHVWHVTSVYFNIWHTLFDTGVYDMALCSRHSFWHSQIIFGTYECFTMVRCVTYIHDLCIIIWYFHNEFDLARSSFLFDIGIPNFGIWVFHHETTCCVQSWPLFYFHLLSILSNGGILSKFYSNLLQSILLILPSNPVICEMCIYQSMVRFIQMKRLNQSMQWKFCSSFIVHVQCNIFTVL